MRMRNNYKKMFHFFLNIVNKLPVLLRFLSHIHTNLMSKSSSTNQPGIR